MNKQEMAAHIDELCREHNIKVGSHSSGGRAYRKKRYIKIRPVKSSITYATALHEIGHVLGKQQSKPRLYSEAMAWVWAKQNARVWTKTMQKDMIKSLKSYYDWAKRKHARGVKNAPRWPEPDHPFWTLTNFPLP